MPNQVDEFNNYRSRMNERLLAGDNKIIKRIFNLDTNAYASGSLDVKTKELLGLVASAVLRCDDCVKYHLEKCRDEGASKEEVMETLSIATLVGGTIVIPHLRRAYEYWEALEAQGPGADFETFARRVEGSSIHASPEAFALFSAELERAPTFHARAAAVLGEETADLYLGDTGRALDLLRPAFGLLPVGRLERLHLAIGADAAGEREPVLGLAGGAPASLPPARLRRDGIGGLLGGLFGGKNDDQIAAADFETQETFGTHDEGPVALAEAIADPDPWPLGLDGRDRYRVLLECADAGTTPFDAVPELDELRRRMRQIESLSEDLGQW